VSEIGIEDDVFEPSSHRCVAGAEKEAADACRETIGPKPRANSLAGSNRLPQPGSL